MKKNVVAYSLFLAGAIIATTAIATNMQDSFASSMLAPGLMSLAIVVVGVRSERRSGGAFRPAGLRGAVLTLACAIVAVKNPANVAAMLPILAAAVVTPLIVRFSRGGQDGIEKS